MNAAEFSAFFAGEALLADEEAVACRRLSTLSASDSLAAQWQAHEAYWSRRAERCRLRAGQILELPAIGRAGARP